MPASAETLPEAFDAGVYSFPAAARLLRGASARQLRYWMRSGLTPPTHPRDPTRPWDSDVLSFHDLVSLELIRRMRTLGVSLQKLRTLRRTSAPTVPTWTGPLRIGFLDRRCGRLGRARTG